MSAIRENFVRSALLSTLLECEGVQMPERALYNQVNIGMNQQGAVSEKEFQVGLKQLLDKGRVDYAVDEDDARLRRWWITEAGKVRLGKGTNS